MAYKDLTLEKRECWKPAMHASSMYLVWECLVQGVKAGTSKKKDLCGIFSFNMSNPKLVVKSSGYVVHSELFQDNIYWAPFYEFQVARFMAGAKDIGKNNDRRPMGHQDGGVTWIWSYVLPHSCMVSCASTV